MVAETPYVVAIVVDSQFGAHLRELNAVYPVWAVDSTANRETATELWGGGEAERRDRGLTLFRAEEGGSPADWCAEIIGTVEEHHGAYSHNPPVTVIEVYGTAATPALREAFAEYGFNEVVNTANGCRARSRPAI